MTGTMEEETKVIDAVADIKIEHFCDITEYVGTLREHYTREYYKLDFRFDAKVVPSIFDEDPESWLEIVPGLTENYPNNGNLSCTVSIIDIEGICRFPRTFNIFPTNGKRVKYLKRSYILNMADDLILKGVLTLRFEFHFIWRDGEDDVKRSENNFKNDPRVMDDFFECTPHTFCKKYGPDSSTMSFFFDLTSRVLTLPPSHNLRNEFESHGLSAKLSRSGLYSRYNYRDIMELVWISKEDSAEIADHFWIFDAEPDRFLLSINKDVGAKLVDASPVIRRCVNAPMKEQREKCFVLSNVEGQTFRIVLFYLKTGNFCFEKISELFNVYEMCHFYEMEDLRKLCARTMTDAHYKRFIDCQEIADVFSDEYLSSLINNTEPDDLESDTFDESVIIDDENRLDANSYI